jgi:hypothetical protein
MNVVLFAMGSEEASVCIIFGLFLILSSRLVRTLCFKPIFQVLLGEGDGIELRIRNGKVVTITRTAGHRLKVI